MWSEHSALLHDSPRVNASAGLPFPPTGRSPIRLLAITLALFALLAPTALASMPGWWLQQAACIHRHESTDWHRTTDWRGYPSRDHGGMQIDVSTWASYAPHGYPSDPAYASPGQQLHVAYLIWAANGRRWGGSQWPATARACGLA